MGCHSHFLLGLRADGVAVKLTDTERQTAIKAFRVAAESCLTEAYAADAANQPRTGEMFRATGRAYLELARRLAEEVTA